MVSSFYKQLNSHDFDFVIFFFILNFAEKELNLQKLEIIEYLFVVQSCGIQIVIQLNPKQSTRKQSNYYHYPRFFHHNVKKTGTMHINDKMN